MEFSNRDAISSPPICCSPLRSQSGQGLVEYLLVLVVAVAIILGGLYQLNSAFKAWANNYFGDYLSCLLETGELPTIGGSPGDSGICEQFFQAFTWDAGRPARESGPSGEKSAEGNGRGSSERGGGGGGGGGQVRSGGSGSGGFTRRFSPSARGGKKISSGGSTGNTDASGYVGGYSTVQRPQNRAQKTKLDNKFAFERQGDRDPSRKVATAARKGEEGGNKGSIKLKPKGIKNATAAAADTEFSIGNFIRILIIVCIILALLLFIGSQVVQISKSMD